MNRALSHTSFYCLGCNEVFVAHDDKCPRCHAPVLIGDETSLGDTMLLPRVVGGAHSNETPLAHERTNDLEQLPGSRLAVYEIEQLLGRGGMGHVFLAMHGDLHRPCAVKVLSPSLVNHDLDFVNRFSREAQSAASLIHANIVTTHAIGEAAGFHFLEMEFVAGRSLQQTVDDDGCMPAIRATSLMVKVAAGLAAAHQKNIVHRDLKPDNILITPRGEPKIADFGLAKRVVGDASNQTATHLAGTPYFMAPELFNGEEATPSSDVYAMGVCYFYLLTGQYPFSGNSFAELMHAVQTEDIPSVRKLSPDVTFEMAECLCLLLAKSPQNRPQNATAAHQLLLAVLGAVRDLESLLSDAFRGNPSVSWKRSGRRYDLLLQLKANRKQTVAVEASDHDLSDQLVLIYSVCCPANAEYFEQALRINSEMPHGALAIREIEGESMFVVVDTYPRGTVDVEEIRRSVLVVAERADEVELELTGADHN